VGEREKQYDIAERSTYYSSKWWGFLRNNPFITMKGGVERDKTTGKLYYYEQLTTIWDKLKLEVELATVKLRRPRYARMAFIISDVI
jgi:hypothetical protein